MSNLLLVNGTVLTLNPASPVLTNKAILIKDGLIDKILDKEEVIAYQGETLDMSGKVIMPGFINAHHHFYSTLVRGLGKAAPSKNFNEVLENLWWRLDKKLLADDIYYSAIISVIDAIKHGTTTIIDHHASPGFVTGSLDLIAKAVLEGGLRANLCYEVSDRDGEKISKLGIEENINWLKKVEKESNGSLKGLFGMHAAFTLENKTLETISELTAGKGWGYHLHVAEALSDEEFSLKHFGKRIVPRLNDFGLLNDKSIAAHCIWVDEDEMRMMAEKGTAVVHNPQSNLNNAVGIADVVKLTANGLTVGLGTDAMTINMMEEIRVAMWAQHLKQENPSSAFMEIANTLLKNNAVIANKYWDNSLGMIAEGKAADLIAIDYYTPTPLDDMSWIGHIIYGLSQCTVDTTIANGKVLMWNKQLCLDIDEEAIAMKSEECARKLWERF